MSQGSGFRIDLAFMFANIAFMQNIEAFRVGGHDAVFDTVVHHLDEMARSVRTAMQIAVFRTGLPSPARCTRRGVGPWRQRGEYRLKILLAGCFTPYHPAKDRQT